jgi:DtxR family transcriptional regulator, Mn-dependent transcriptional regulator
VSGIAWCEPFELPLVSVAGTGALALGRSIVGQREAAVTAHGLIDTTEMYLRTVFELTEEGIVPLRARIAERLSQSGPTVSETVARMERDGLLRVAGDRQLSLTEEGSMLATRVMRKHRLAECLLVDVIGLPWEEVHLEACRWEHVISDNVERRLADLLHYPVRCPHGNVIPGLAELGVPAAAVGRGEAAAQERALAMTVMVTAGAARVIVRRIGEQLQSDAVLMLKLKNIGIQPGREITLAASGGDIQVTGAGRVDGLVAVLPREVAAHLFVSEA